ncbi:putative duf803 domain-containing protein [Erysiphe neolycopersici]|uniref:Putative duf803 domain-containing protein n=1 Tax=Erysiphe neolycopersici TaxID=212602 RepID=A0A420HGZ5_9PEZI|nr:putative duf803 domain-containing protein [Erysiphe neolycopersici]
MANLGGLTPGGSIAIGILVGLVSTNVQSIGLTLQRKSHVLEDENSQYDIKRPPYRRGLWQVGMGMFIISNLIGSTIQITTLPLPVLSTLQASGLVFNSICATFILGEPFTRWSICGTLLISTGAVLIAIFGAIPEPAHTLDQLLFLLVQRNFIMWMIMQAILVTGIIIITGFLSQIQNLSSRPRVRFLCGLAYGGVSGILSAHSLLVAKSAVELLVRTIVDRVNQFDRWQSWAIILGLIVLALTQLYYLHRGLKLVSTSVLYPIVFCIYNIIAILDGLIYFKQTDRLKPLHAGLITLGTSILLSGVLAISWRLSDDQSQPAVGKSALAPGLGLIDDTDTEEYSDSIDADEDVANEAERLPLLSNAFIDSIINKDNNKGKGQYTQMFGQLSDAEEIWNPAGHTSHSEYRTISSRSPKRLVTMPELYNSVIHGELRSLKTRKRRRKSSVFPGFIARPSSTIIRKKSNQGTRYEFWKMNWLGIKPNKYRQDKQPSNGNHSYIENENNESFNEVNDGSYV